MKIKIFAILTIISIFAGSIAVAGAKTKRSAPKTAELLAMLPASDMAMTLDTKRLFDEALPQMLATNQSMLAQLISKVDQIKDKTGLDLRQFHDVAVGLSAKKNSQGTFAFEPMVLARGKFSSEAVMAFAKLGAGSEFREEKIGGKTVLIFSAEKMIAESKAKNDDSMISGVVDTVIDGLSREVAITSIDDATIAVGSVPQMRAMLEGRSRIAPEVAYLATRRPGAIVSLGAAVPDGLSTIVNLDNDTLGTSLNSIRQISAALDVADGATSLWVAARTANPASALDLKMTLDDFQSIGKTLLSRSKGDDKRVYQRMVENAKITHLGTEVAIDLKVPQADMNVLVAQLK